MATAVCKACRKEVGWFHGGLRLRDVRCPHCGGKLAAKRDDKPQAGGLVACELCATKRREFGSLIRTLANRTRFRPVKPDSRGHVELIDSEPVTLEPGAKVCTWHIPLPLTPLPLVQAS